MNVIYIFKKLQTSVTPGWGALGSGRVTTQGEKDNSMIAMAVQRGSYVEVYDERGYRLTSIYAGDAQLVGFTASVVTIHRGSYNEMYDEKGYRINSVYVG